MKSKHAIECILAMTYLFSRLYIRKVAALNIRRDILCTQRQFGITKASIEVMGLKPVYLPTPHEPARSRQYAFNNLAIVYGLRHEATTNGKVEHKCTQLGHRVRRFRQRVEVLVKQLRVDPPT